MTSVELRNIDQAFGSKEVLCGLDLAVETGQYIVLLGASGCGKTTALRIIAGLQSPQRGEVLIGGQVVNRVAPRDRNVAMIFQNDSLYPHLTVDQSIRFALRGQLRADELERRVNEAVELTQIGTILDRYPNRLSGGELRRAAIAKAIARRATVRLLDEPLSALDIPVRHALQDDILRWHAEVPGTSIHVTHDGQEAMKMADKIAVMEGGRIVQYATPTELFSSPRTVSVAQAIGTPPINLFHGKVAGGSVVLPDDNISCRITVNVEDNREVIVGVRPEALVVIDDADTSGHGLTFEGRTSRLRRVGSEVHVHLDAPHPSVLAVMPVGAFHDPENAESSIRIAAASEAIHVFDVKSGHRMDSESDG